MDFNVWTLSLKRLTNPFKLFELNFNSDSESSNSFLLDQTTELEVTVIEDGRPRACLYCFDIEFSRGVQISTLDASFKWHHAAVVIDTKATVLKDQKLKLSGSLKNSWIDVFIKEVGAACRTVGNETEIW